MGTAIFYRVLIRLSWGRTHRELLDMDVVWPYKEQQTFVVSYHDWSAKQDIRFITENVTNTISGLCK